MICFQFKICIRLETIMLAGMSVHMVVGYIICNWQCGSIEGQGFFSCDHLSDIWYINRICD